MKKLLLATLIASVLSVGVSAAWLQGTIDNVSIYTGTMYISVNASSKRIDPALSADAQKVIQAAALTAFASGKQVKLRYSGTTSGTWDAIQLLP